MTRRPWRAALAALWLGLLMPVPVLAQEPAPAACPPAARLPTAEERAAALQQARDRGFLWRISKNGRSSYLYGTIHIGQMDWMFPGPAVSAALQASQVLALELDLTDDALMQRLQSGMSGRQKGDQPRPALPDDLAQRLRAQLRAACAPGEMLDAMAPEMVGALLTMLSVRRDGLDASYGIDPALAQLARAQQKETVSLETPELQLRLLHSRSARELREGLEKVLADLETGRARALLLRVAQAWAEGRADELANYRAWCECADTAHDRAALRTLLDERNKPMAARIDALHKAGKTVFVAVGSLHMFGPAALPALMAKRGYRVERIAFAP